MLERGKKERLRCMPRRIFFFSALVLEVKENPDMHACRGA
jgi:hypothetical protein